MITIKPFVSPYEYIQITKPQGYSLSLKVGEVVRAEVIDILPSGGVVIRMKGSYITVRTEIPLQKESSLLLKILELPQDNRLKIQLLGVLDNKGNISINKTDLSQISLNSLARLINIENLTDFEKIMLFQVIKDKIKPVNLQETLSYGFIKQISPETIKQAIYNSGIFLEAKLKNIIRGKKEDIKNDIKANLLITIDKSISGTGDKNKTLLNDIYMYQLLSRLTDSIYTYIPQILKGVKNFDLSYKKIKKGIYVVKLDINLETYGRVLVILNYNSTFLNIFFKFEDKKFQLMCEKYIEALKKKLSDIKTNIFFFGDNISFENIETFEISNHIMDIKI